MYFTTFFFLEFECLEIGSNLYEIFNYYTKDLKASMTVAPGSTPEQFSQLASKQANNEQTKQASMSSTTK